MAKIKTKNRRVGFFWMLEKEPGVWARVSTLVFDLNCLQFLLPFVRPFNTDQGLKIESVKLRYYRGNYTKKTRKILENDYNLIVG